MNLYYRRPVVFPPALKQLDRVHERRAHALGLQVAVSDLWCFILGEGTKPTNKAVKVTICLI